MTDTTAPAAPSTPDLAASSDSGLSNSDDLTFIVIPQFIGTAEANSKVTVVSDVDGEVGFVIASGGTYAVTVSTLAESVHAILAYCIDVAGNIGANSSALTVTIDITPLPPPLQQIFNPTLTVDCCQTTTSPTKQRQRLTSSLLLPPAFSCTLMVPAQTLLSLQTAVALPP